MSPRPHTPTLLPYTTLFRSQRGDGTRRTTRYDIDLTKCIFCGFCEESCPVDSIVETRILEYHGEKRGDLIYTKPMLLAVGDRSEEHTSELQSQSNLVCRLLHEPPPTHTYPPSLHDALPISTRRRHAPHHALRHRSHQVHLLRLLRGVVPGGFDRGDPHPRIPRREAGGPDLHQADAARGRRQIGRAHV